MDSPSPIHLETTIHFEQLSESGKRICVFQGGSRSGKTVNILTWILFHLRTCQGQTVTICRKTLPALKATAMRDFVALLQKFNIYSESDHNKSENTYNLFGNMVEFISLDQPQKVRGRKRDILFINEANEVDFESWNQLIIRTPGRIIIDYNPSDEYHWIYEHVITRSDCDFFQSTYRDNPFLEPSLVEEIENLQHVDDNLWRVFGLGERGRSGANIYTHWQEITEWPTQIKDWTYGLDFGFNHPSALIKVAYHEGKLYWHEEIYQTKLTNADLISIMKQLDIPKSKYIYGDDANPREIEDIARAGYNIRAARKGSVGIGINKIKSTPLFITRSSVNLLKEIRAYKWKEDRNGKVLDEPVKFQDHALDGARYACHALLTTGPGTSSGMVPAHKSPFGKA